MYFQNINESPRNDCKCQEMGGNDCIFLEWVINWIQINLYCLELLVRARNGSDDDGNGFKWPLMFKNGFKSLKLPRHVKISDDAALA